MKRFNDLLTKFHEERQTMEKIPSILQRSSNLLKFCNEILSEMKNVVEDIDFETVGEEIYFFKEVKPIPMSYFIYYTHIQNCELHRPKAGKQYKIRFLEKEMRKVNKFFFKNTDFTYYMEQGYSYLDHTFFTRRGVEKFPMNPTENQYFYPEFSSSHDLLWAKIKAMYRYIHYLREQLQKLNGGPLEFTQDSSHRVIVWTGSKTALVELVYALYVDGSLNHGKLDLKTIASSFEAFFNIRLDNVSKTYMEIKSRKGSKTKFLDDLGMQFQLKMEREDA
ncbi:RteC domain-containing protein [Zunongwangia endophytica]|uniref:RteC domain-containing protein n=1 Tax=Zunongwangia endophytica TaxID=1808945 RepID=A0ABV8HCE5_9FLAO|nr:RteC domain-containing protein [Zunongwangia endophytica]MDN3594385.1 RteC domain-containing protein [Zunongwangia endophytica]